MARRKDNTTSIIKELKRDHKVTNQQLNSRIEQPDLPSLAGYFDSIDDGCLQKMNLTPGQQSDVRTKALLGGTSAGMMWALQQWLNAQLRGTFRALIIILLSLDKKLMAVKVFQYLSNEDEPNHEQPESSSSPEPTDNYEPNPESPSSPEPIVNKPVYTRQERRENKEEKLRDPCRWLWKNCTCKVRLMRYIRVLIFAIIVFAALKFLLPGSTQNEPFLCENRVYNQDDIQYDYQGPEGPAALVAVNNLWSINHGEDVLKYCIMNPKKLKEVNLNENNIKSWAEKWKRSPFNAIPELKLTGDCDRADIRIEISPGGGSWSKVGIKARLVDTSEPTMVLGLQKDHHNYNEHVVVHEFGHALGLVHEHQRSKFWSIAKRFIDIDKMKTDSRLKKTNIVKDMLQFKKDPGVGSEEYDPDSVMHYWFDLSWLKNKEYKDKQKVKSDQSLTEEDKKVLLGIHKRHLSYASEPSETDLKFLNNCYKKISDHDTPPVDPPPVINSEAGAPSDKTRPVILNSKDEGEYIYFNTLYNAVYKEGRNKWQNIGSALNIGPADITAIKKGNQDLDDCLRNMLLKWFEVNEKCCLSTFLEALKTSSVQLKSLIPHVRKAIISAQHGDQQ